MTDEPTPSEEDLQSIVEEAEYLPEPPQEATEEPKQDDADQDAGDEDKGSSKAAREAKKYRLQLRETQSKLDEVNGQLEALRRDVVEDLASAAGISKPASIWTAGFDIATVQDDAGNIDQAAATEALKAFADESGLAVNGVKPDPVQVAQANPVKRHNGEAQRWADSFRV